MADGGDEAIATLQRKKRKVDLVVTRTILPDMCAFKLVQILNTKFEIAVVLICDFHHEPTILRGLLYGAISYLSNPLRTNDIGNLWQHVIKKRIQVHKACESNKRSIVGYDEYEIYEGKLMKRLLESSARGESSQIREHNISDFDEVDGWVMELPVSFNWNIEFHWKLLAVVVGTGVDVAVPSEVHRLIGSPGLTMQYVTDKLQEYHMCLRGQQDLRSKRIIYDHEPSQIVEELMAKGSSTSEEQPRITGFLSNAENLVHAMVIRRQDDPAEETILI